MKTIRTTIVAAIALAIPLVASAQTLYWGGGTANKNDGDPLPSSWTDLAGDWTSSLLNWSSAVNPTVYQAWSDGSFAHFGVVSGTAGAHVNVVPNFSPTITGAFFDSTGISTQTRYLVLAPSASQNLTLSDTRTRFLIQADRETAFRGINLGSNMRLAGSNTLVKDGLGSLLISSNSSDTFTGPIEVRSSILNVQNTGYIAGVNTVNVLGYRGSPSNTGAGGNEWSTPKFEVNAPNTSGTINQLSDNLVVTLSRGLFGWQSNNAGTVENISQIKLAAYGEYGRTDGTAGGYVNLTHSTQGIDRGSGGTGTLMMYVDNTGNQGVLRSGLAIQNAGSIPTDTLLPWATTNRGGFLYVDSSDSNKLKLINQTIENNLSNWTDPTANYLITGAVSGTLPSNAVINSLGNRQNNPTITINDNLTIASGGVVATSALTFGGTGNLTTTAGQFYFNAPNTLTVNSLLSGNYDIIKSGVGDLTIGGTAGNNTVTGNLIVNAGMVQLNKAGALPNVGSIVVHPGGGVRLGAANAFNASAPITLGKDALLVTATAQHTLNGALTINGGVVNMDTQSLTLNGSGTGLVFNGGLIGSSITGTTSRQLQLQTNVSYAADSDSQAVIQRNIFTGNPTGVFSVWLTSGSGTATRTFDIANSNTLAADVPEMLIDAPIVNGGTGTGALVKTGNGTLKLTGVNTYTGGTTINGGTLHLGRIDAAAQSGLTATATNSGGINQRVVTFNQPITGTMAVGQIISGTGLNQVNIVGILDEYRVFTSAGAGTGANILSTNVALTAVSRVGSLAGNVTVNNSGRLLLDTGTSVGGQVTVNNGGVLAGTGSFNGGLITGSVQPGHSIGTLTSTNDVTWNGGGDAWVFELGTAGLNMANPGTSDLLDITSGSFFKGTGSGFTFDFAGTGQLGWYKLVDWTGSTDFVAGDFTATNLTSGYVGQFTVDSATSALYLNVIPEPGTTGVLMLGAAALWLRRRLRRG